MAIATNKCIAVIDSCANTNSPVQQQPNHMDHIAGKPVLPANVYLDLDLLTHALLAMGPAIVSFMSLADMHIANTQPPQLLFTSP